MLLTFELAVSDAAEPSDHQSPGVHRLHHDLQQPVHQLLQADPPRRDLPPPQTVRDVDVDGDCLPHLASLGCASSPAASAGPLEAVAAEQRAGGVARRVEDLSLLLSVRQRRQHEGRVVHLQRRHLVLQRREIGERVRGGSALKWTMVVTA